MYSDIKDAYNKILKLFDEQIKWYEEIPLAVSSFNPGMICAVPTWFDKRKRWRLESYNYNIQDEAESTWKVREYTGQHNPIKHQYVMKFFEIEATEDMITAPGKRRPALLLNKIRSTWRNPSTTTHHENKWLILPIFSYHPRHDNADGFITDDFLFNNLERIYFPSGYRKELGIEKHSAGLLEAIQSVPETDIEFYKDPYNKKIRLSDFAFNIVHCHVAKFFGYETNPEMFENYTMFIDLLKTLPIFSQV